MDISLLLVKCKVDSLHHSMAIHSYLYECYKHLSYLFYNQLDYLQLKLIHLLYVNVEAIGTNIVRVMNIFESHLETSLRTIGKIFINASCNKP